MSGDVFKDIPPALDALRMFPKWGGWAMLGGNPLAMARGTSIPSFCGRLGLRRMDIFWVDEEQIPAALADMTTRKGRSRVSRWEDESDTKDMDRDELIDYISEQQLLGPWGAPDIQMTILTARLGRSERIRFWNGELRTISEESRKLYLSENAYEVVPLHHEDQEPVPPILDEALRDVVDAMRLDGLSKSEAVEEILKHNMTNKEGEADLVATMECQKPNYYMRVKDEYYYVFND